jgi:hypothetical protein
MKDRVLRKRVICTFIDRYKGKKRKREREKERKREHENERKRRTDRETVGQ